MEKTAYSPTGLLIEAMLHDDLSLLHQVQPASWDDIAPNFRVYLDSAYCYTVKASIDGQLVGTGAALMYGNAAWIAGIITHTKYRNQGIGTAVTRHVVEHAQQQCSSVLLVATSFGKPVYLKLGFKEDGEYLFFNKGKLALPVPPAVVAFNDRYRQQVLDIDALVTGEQRAELLIPHLEHAFVYMEDGTVKGFTIPSLGEGLTLAVDDEAGIALMKQNLQQEKRIALPVANKSGIDFLIRNGFEPDETRDGVKMYTGACLPWKPECTYGRIGGNLG